MNTLSLRHLNKNKMKPLFIGYATCDTCRKALKWLAAHGIEADTRDIVTQNPSAGEIAGWIGRSNRPLTGFFNTSGVRYRELRLKERIKSASQEELLDLLATDGKLVKRPVLVTEERVLIGFAPQEWEEALLNNPE